MANLKIGDVVEIITSKGLAYAQYAHKHKQYGAMLRVFRRIFVSRPSEIPELVESEPAFMCFFPLGAAVDKGIVAIVEHCALPSNALRFPVFRAGVVDPSTSKVAVWWLWDGEKEWTVGELSEEQRKLSIRGVWNDALLVQRIESGWTPEKDST